MRCFRITFFLIILAAVMQLAACSGVKPLQKGQTLRCPSCGAEFTVEQGIAAEKDK